MALGIPIENSRSTVVNGVEKAVYGWVHVADLVSAEGAEPATVALDETVNAG